MAGRQPNRERAPPTGNPRLNQYFVPRDGIDREVITADICRYLGNDALVKPGWHEQTAGYYIKAYRNLTSAMIEDLKVASAKWDAERRRDSTRAYTNSTTYQQSRQDGAPPPDDPQYGRDQYDTAQSYGSGNPGGYPAGGSYMQPSSYTSGQGYPSSYTTSGGGYQGYPGDYPSGVDPRGGYPYAQPGYANPAQNLDVDMDGGGPYVATANFQNSRPQVSSGMISDPRWAGADPRDVRGDPRIPRDPPRDLARDDPRGDMYRGGPTDFPPGAGPYGAGPGPAGYYDRPPLGGAGASSAADYSSAYDTPSAYAPVPQDALYGRSGFTDASYPAGRGPADPVTTSGSGSMPATVADVGFEEPPARDRDSVPRRSTAQSPTHTSTSGAGGRDSKSHASRRDREDRHRSERDDRYRHSGTSRR